jgi:predicted dienelactone hydrolase
VNNLILRPVNAAMLHVVASLLLGQGNYEPLLGNLTPVSTHVTLSRSGQRSLELRVTFPKESGKYPLIVYSHGFRGTLDTYDPLIKTWVSHGYVCIQPNHADSIVYFKGNLRNAFKVNASAFANWDERPQEMAMIIDRLSEIQNQVKSLSAKVDATRIGMGGHSFGAHTSSLLAGAMPRTGQSIKDKRAKAFLLLSPQGEGNGFSSEAWADMTGPVMSVTGTEDVSIVPTTPAIRRMPFDRSPAGNKFLLWIEGAHHNLGGISGRWFPTSGKPDATILKTVEATTLAFWDKYLKSDKRANQFLVADEAKSMSGGIAHIERR